MPSKKRKYNARFPAGRIKKIMQTDEEVGKVAQAVPVIIYIFASTPRTLELFVESLLSKAMQVTQSRNAKTLSPSHVKQCILAEAKFDFLRDLVKNIPDVSAAEEKEMQMSEESSPNSSRFADTTAPPRRIVREDSNSSSSCEVRVQPTARETRDTQSLPREPPKENIRDTLRRVLSANAEAKTRAETVTNTPVPTSTIVSSEAIDLTKKKEPVRTANFYQEIDQIQHRTVIKVNPTYNCPQPSTSNSSFASLTPVEPVAKIQMPKPEVFYLDVRQNNNIMTPPRTPITPVLNIDFSKNLANPEIKVLDSNIPSLPNMPIGFKEKPRLHRQNSKPAKSESKRERSAPISVDINSGNLQIDEDYDT